MKKAFGLSLLLGFGLSAQQEFVQQLIKVTNPIESVQKELMALASENTPIGYKNSSLEFVPPLYVEYPELVESLPYISLGFFPTPIQHLATTSMQTGINLYCKQDGQCGGCDNNGNKLFGGNKVRKLEFLFADALSRGASSVMTFGCAGSNHATATAAYAYQQGLDCICMLKEQPNSQVVRRNLALMNYYGADIRYYPTVTLRALGAIAAAVDYKQESGNYPYIISTGGSWPVGIIGFVNAAAELKQQILAGVMPEPDYIYVAAGSLGTVVGLLLGCKAVGLTTRVVAVAIEPSESMALKKRIKILFQETNQLLHACASSFPLISLRDDEIVVRHESAGEAYALFTDDALAYMKKLHENDGVVLDGTYTGKAFHGLMLDAERGMLEGKTVLFWNTFDASAFESEVSNSTADELPNAVRAYFVEDVQERDRS